MGELRLIGGENHGFSRKHAVADGLVHIMPNLMKTHIINHLLTTILAGVLVSCANTPTPTRVPVSTAARSDNSLGTQLFQAINDYRRSQGSAELQRHAGLDQLARKHSEYLSEHQGTFSLEGKNVSHMGFEGRTLVAREIYHMSNISENVAAANHPGAYPVPVLLALMKSSQNHRKNMLDVWTHTGVGIVVAPDGTTYVTQLFANQCMSQMATRQRFNQF